ncbi:MAG: hypothetical protein ACRDU8_07745 [Egibacteraceae bacterium]
MTSLRTTLVGVLLLLAACGTAGSTTPVDTATAARERVRSALANAQTVSKEYGMQHLGHYHRFDDAALADAGFAPPEGVTVAVASDHFGFCLTATHDELGPGDPWRTASIDETAAQPSPKDRCSR